MSLKKYANDYELVVTKDEQGNEKTTTQYKGDFFKLSISEADFQIFKSRCVALAIVIAVLHVLGGFINNAGMRQFYVALPYVIVFFPLLYLLIGVFRLPKPKQKYYRHEIGLSFNRVKKASRILLIVSAIGFIGEIVFIIFASAGSPMRLELPFLLTGLLVMVGAFFIISLQKRINVLPCNQDSD